MRFIHTEPIHTKLLEINYTLLVLLSLLLKFFEL